MHKKRLLRDEIVGVGRDHPQMVGTLIERYFAVEIQAAGSVAAHRPNPAFSRGLQDPAVEKNLEALQTLFSFHRTAEAHAPDFHVLAILRAGDEQKGGGFAFCRDFAHAFPFPAFFFELLMELDGPGFLNLKLLVEPVELCLPGGQLRQPVFELALLLPAFCRCRPDFLWIGLLKGLDAFLGLVDLQSGLHPGGRQVPYLVRPHVSLVDAGVIRVALREFLQEFRNLSVVVGLPSDDDGVEIAQIVLVVLVHEPETQPAGADGNKRIAHLVDKHRGLRGFPDHLDKAPVAGSPAGIGWLQEYPAVGHDGVQSAGREIDAGIDAFISAENPHRPHAADISGYLIPGVDLGRRRFFFLNGFLGGGGVSGRGLGPHGAAAEKNQSRCQPQQQEYDGLSAFFELCAHC